jgi:hypothetical protein
MSLMMMKTNPITPPRELVREWYGSEDCPDGANALANYLCTQAAQWGADQELEATLGLMATLNIRGVDYVRNARRPKPPSLKEQALEALEEMNEPLGVITVSRVSAIRRALETLDD